MKEAGKNTVNDWLAGACAGVCGLIVGFPFETTKVQMQTATDGSDKIRVVDMFKKIKTDGMFSGFFRGLTMPLCSYTIFSAIYFGVYGHTLQKIRNWRGHTEVTYPDLMLASLVAGLSTLIPQCPIEVIKCTLQSQAGNRYFAKGQITKYYSGPVQCMASIYKQQGVVGLYKGLDTLIIRELPASITYIPSFVFYNEMLGKYTPLHPEGFITGSLAGGLSGVTMWGAMMPFDAVKTRLQSDSLGEKYSGVVDCVKKTYQSGGVRIFFRGFIVCAIRAFPCNATVLVVYKKTLAYLNSLNVPPIYETSIPEVSYISDR